MTTRTYTDDEPGRLAVFMTYVLGITAGALIAFAL
jgi:hypothetical protein